MQKTKQKKSDLLDINLCEASRADQRG